MCKKNLYKKIIFVFLCILLYTNVIYAKHPHNGMSQEEIDKEEDYRKNVLYPEFIEALKNNNNYSTGEQGRAIFGVNNENLIIGCSPVAYMSIYGQEIVDNYDYDIVGFGSTIDADMLSWLKMIDKKYNKIVIWGAANDIMNTMKNNDSINDEYFSTLDNLLIEAKNHLNKSPMSKVVYINVKSMVNGLDKDDKEYCEKYNFFAKLINNHIKEKNIENIDITSETNEDNSEWYLHFTNAKVFNKIFLDVEMLDG